MNLVAVLENACPGLARSWVAEADAIYPFAAVGFVRTSKDPFTNPVGQRTRDLAPLLCLAVLGLPHDDAALSTALEEFVRVRAMQDVPAEATLRVLFAYKKIIRTHCREQGIPLPEEDRDNLDERCDTLALRAFGLYARFRETFFEARIDDVRRRHSQIVRLAQRHGMAEPAPSLAPGTIGPELAEKTR